MTVDWSQIRRCNCRLSRASSRRSRRSVVSIVDKLDELPLKAIGDDVRKTLGEVDHTLVSARGTLDSGRDTLRATPTS